MRFLFYIGHPAHYLNISIVLDQLAEREHDILLVAREKDILLDLIKDLPYDIYVIKKRTGRSKAALVFTILKRSYTLYRAARTFKPDLLAGTDIAIAHIGRLLNIPSIIINEDDAGVVPMFTRFGTKYATHLLSPQCCNNAPYQYKTAGYPGYHELAYLHPNHFRPDRSRIQSLLTPDDHYFILRFAALTAHHDRGKKGINDQLAQDIINLLQDRGSVYITSERPLPPALESYRITLDPRDIHHALAFADMYIGDSQTMTAEAAVLGTPAIRFNDFVGQLSYLEELEHRYELTYGIPTDQPDRLFSKIKQLLGTSGLKETWQKRRTNMLRDTIDVAAFFSWFFEQYPSSVDAVRNEPGVTEPFR